MFPDPRVRDVLGGLLGEKQGRHSTLYLWMRRNRVHMARQIARKGADWAELAAALGEAGLKDRTGKAPSAATVKQTWYRVCQRADDGRDAKPVPEPRHMPERRPGESVPGVRAVACVPEPVRPAMPAAPPSPRPAAVTPADDGGYRPKMVLTFKGSRPRSPSTGE